MSLSTLEPVPGAGLASTPTSSRALAGDQGDENVELLSIQVQGVSKRYQLWRSPTTRLRYSILSQLRKLIPARPERPFGRWRDALAARRATLATDFYALRGVSFEVRRGESVGIVGLNGSGKSTLLQIIAGTLRPTEGDVQVRGRVAALLELGSGFNPEFTGRENVRINAAILGLSPAEVEERFDAIVDFAEIGPFIDEPVKTYSSGMVLRLAFAVTTQVRPDILIVDEALSVGDAYFAHKCMAHIRRFRAEGGSLFLVSHDPRSVKSLCDRALLLDRGVLVRDGPPEGIIDYYNAIVAKKEKDAEIRQTETSSGRVRTESGTGEASFAEVELLTARTGQPARAFTVGEEAVLVCRVRFRRPVEKPTVGFVIRDRLGGDVFGTNTFHLDAATSRGTPDRVLEVRFRLPLHLGVGTYSVTVAVHVEDAHTHGNYHWLDNVLAFQIVPVGAPAFVGVVNLPVRVESRAFPDVREAA